MPCMPPNTALTVAVSCYEVRSAVMTFSLQCSLGICEEAHTKSRRENLCTWVVWDALPSDDVKIREKEIYMNKHMILWKIITVCLLGIALGSCLLPVAFSPFRNLWIKENDLNILPWIETNNCFTARNTWFYVKPEQNHWPVPFRRIKREREREMHMDSPVCAMRLWCVYLASLNANKLLPQSNMGNVFVKGVLIY